MQTEFKLYKVDMKYIRNLHHIDDRVLSVSPQTGKDTRVFVGIVIICGTHKYCVPLSSPKEKHKRMRNSMDFSKIEVGDWKPNAGNTIPDNRKTARQSIYYFDQQAVIRLQHCKRCIFKSASAGLHSCFQADILSDQV